MKQLLFLLLALALFSCNRQSDFEKKLIKSKWVMFAGKALNDEIDRWPNSYCKFTEDGKFSDFWIYDDEPQNMRVNDDGSINTDPISWRYNPDKKELILNKYKFKVLSIEGDTIRLQRDTTNVMLYNIDKTYPKLKKGPGRCLGG